MPPPPVSIKKRARNTQPAVKNQQRVRRLPGNTPAMKQMSAIVSVMRAGMVPTSTSCISFYSNIS